MIGLEELYALRNENETKLSEIKAENRVLDKLIEIEKSRQVEPSQPCEEIVEQVVEQVDESY